MIAGLGEPDLVALAEAVGAPFVTADRRLARALARGGARVVFLGDLG